MDTLTHAISGAVLARATAANKPSATDLSLTARTVAGFLVAAFPDSDYVLTFFDPMLYLTAHRGVTHSIIMLPLWALALSFVLQLLWRQRYHWKKFFPVCALSLAIHIFGDVITSFGTMIFSPFSDVRISLSTTFIIDLYFSGILLAGLVLSFPFRKFKMAALTLAILCGYIIMQAILQLQAREHAQDYANINGLTSARISVLPQPLSPFNWKLIIENGDDIHMAYVNLFTEHAPRDPAPDAGFLEIVASAYYPVKQAQWEIINRFGNNNREQALARLVWQQEGLERFRWFAMFPVLFRYEDNNEKQCAWFADMRFSLKGRQPPFLYGMCREKMDAHWNLNRLSRKIPQ